MGVAARGNTVHVAIAAWPWGAYLGADGLEKGIRVKTSSFLRHHVNVTMCRAKASGNYINSILANQEATMNGYDEALLLDVNGYVAEGAGENLFIVKDGVVYEPSVTSGLIGITRNTIITLCADLGIPFREKLMTRDDVYLADEAFFTGTAAEVTPIRELDDRPVGAGSRGPVTARLQNAFFEIVNGQGPLQPLKHTVRVLPGGFVDLDLTADAPGDWAFHCHLLYHMHAGMMRVVTVRPLADDAA